MHKTLTNWRARRSGAAMTVSGRDENGNTTKFTATAIDGPDATRLALPRSTVAWLADGNPVELLVA